MSKPEPFPGERHPRQYCFGDFTLDLEGGFLRRAGEEVTLRPKAFEVLACLVEHHGRLVTKTALIEAVWPDAAITDNSLAQCLLEVRRAIGDDSQQIIRTVARRGYLFTAPVTTPVVEFPRHPAGPPAEIGPLPVLPSPPARKRLHNHFRSGALITLAMAAGGLLALWLTRPAGTSPAKDMSFTQLTDQAGEETFPSLSPDGRSFAYAARPSGNWDIYFQRAGGKNPVNLTKDCPTDDTQPAFSPDGEQIAFRSERNGGGIFVMGATGESVRRLTDFGFNPGWSPDGKEIVFATAMAWGPAARVALDSQLWVVNASSGEKRMLTKPSVTPDAVQPNWSPHGHRIAYWAVHSGQRDIWTVSAGGLHPVAVTQDAALDWSPVWSPDGSYLYFASDRAGSMNLCRVRIDEKSGRVLGRLEPVTTPSPYSGPISISRDGRRIAYVQQLTTTNIQTAGFDPVKERIVSQPQWITQGSRQARHPDLSADREWLAFHDGAIFVVKTDGTGLRQLTNDAYKNRHPRWSPDGQRIAFVSNHGGQHDVWLIHPDGSALERLTYTSAPGIFFPVWSPDGRRLVYTVPGAGPLVMDVAKPWKEQSPKRVKVPPAFGAQFQVGSWSPDGRKLAGALLKADGVSVLGLGIYSLESERLERLPEFGYYPVWLGDSRRLLFQDHRGKLYLTDSRSGNSREILSAAPNHISGVTLSRNDRLIYLSVVVNEADIWLATLE